jgi:O-antigen/teichoic acid export membrane protein
MNELRAQVRRVRLGLLAFSVPPLILMTLAGPEITGFLFDERYQAAGWMIQILGVGALFVTILVPVSSTLLAVGDSFGQMVFQIARTLSIIVFVILGGWLGTRGANVFGYTYTPLTGLLTGYVVGSLAYYPLLAAQVRRHNTWMPGLDAIAVTVSLGTLALGFWLRTLM